MTENARRASGFGRFRRTVLGGALGVTALAAACKGLPDVTFDDGTIDGGSHDGDTDLDATLPPTGDDAGRADVGVPSDSGGKSGEDGGPESNDASDDAGAFDTEDASVPEGGIACGDASVDSCAQCPGATLRCKKGASDRCVSECSSCSTGWLPCWHCTGKGAPRGTCLAVANDGVLACATGNACACDAAADCPSGAGGAQVCFNDASVPGGGSCATCGQASTNAMACVNEDDAGGIAASTGTCAAGTTTPTCE